LDGEIFKMSEKGTENLPEKSSFQLMDEEDERQIISDSTVQESLVYTAQGKKTLSYTGIKFLFQKWIESKHLSVEIIHAESYCNLEKDDADNQAHWYWRGKFTLRTTRIDENGKPQIIETQGQQESGYLFKNEYDPFGRTKAFSKSERNADRKQIPEFEITHMINEIDPKNIKNLDSGNNFQKSGGGTMGDPPTEKQLEFLKNLGYTGRKPDTKQIASNIIEDLKNGAKESKTAATEKPAQSTASEYTSPAVYPKPDEYCKCETPKPKFEISQETQKHHCYTCGLPVTDEQAKKLLNLS